MNRDNKKTPAPQSAGNEGANARVYERVYIRKSLGGWCLVPADPSSYPLLERLVEGDLELLRKILEWDSLEEGLRGIRGSADLTGLKVSFCGNLKRSPTALLSVAPTKPEPEKPVRIFKGATDHAKWGVTDFYEEDETELREALRSGAPFDTGWYGVKKEIQSGRITRPKRNGKLYIEVSTSMDSAMDLADTAMWRAAGGNAYCDSGLDALMKVGLTEERADETLESVGDDLGLGEDNTVSRDLWLHAKTGFDRLCQRMDEILDDADGENEVLFKALIERCKEAFDEIKREQGASCRNCKHYSPEIPQSRVNPADPATCDHPKHGSILSVNKHFPFERGCKFWMSKKA